MQQSSSTRVDDVNEPIWKSAASMTEKRREAAFAVIDDDRFLMIGGYYGVNILSSGKMYNRRTNEWKTLPNAMPNGGRSGCAAATISNIVYVVGGYPTLDELIALNKSTFEWETLPSMKQKRFRCAAVAVGRYIYVFGGSDSRNAWNTAERYNIDTKIWEDLPSMSTVRYGCGAVAVQNKIYVIGGMDNQNNTLASVEVFDVDTQTWESPSSVTDMSIGRYGLAAVVIGRFVVVLGGADSNDNDTSSSVEVLDTSTGYWTESPQKMTTPRSLHGAVVLGDSNIYVAGGRDDSDTVLDTCESITSKFLLPISNTVDAVRSPSLLNDATFGKDRLGIAVDLLAITQMILLRDLLAPFVLALLGGWGSGKSFAFHLILQFLIEIQKINLSDIYFGEDGKNFPYCGHIYYVKFDSWTFAKGNLWASLMHQILVALNDQLHLEAVLREADPKLLMKGVSTIQLMEDLSSGELKYLEKLLIDEDTQSKIKDITFKNQNVTQALIDATSENYTEDLKKLREKQKELAWKLTYAQSNDKSKILPEIKLLLEKAFKKYKKPRDKEEQSTSDSTNNEGSDEATSKTDQCHDKLFKFIKTYLPFVSQNNIDEVPETIQDGVKLFNFVERYYQFFRTGRLTGLWWAVLVVSFFFYIIIPYVLEISEGFYASSIVPLVSTAASKINDTKKKLAELDKEGVLAQALEDANEAKVRSETEDIENQEGAIQKLKADISSLQDRVWLVEGDSLDEVVKKRIESGDYEKQLGIVHKAQMDLKRLSDAMFSNAKYDKEKEKPLKDKIFPRGDPRIVLFIDDIDRCPPMNVVETLEAIQLLVKTALFVVVVAIDARYVSLALENAYKGILSADRHPSGLDYLEKIIQLGYRLPPIQTKEMMKSFIRAQIGQTTEEEANESSNKSTKEAVQDEIRRANDVHSGADDAGEGVEETKEDHGEEEKNEILPEGKENTEESGDRTDGQIEESTNTASGQEQPSHVTPPTSQVKTMIPRTILTISENEAIMLEEACLAADVSPRAGIRLVNVFKVMKLIWYRIEENVEFEAKEPSDKTKKAFVLLLALSASSKKNIRLGMCKFFAMIEEKRGVDDEGQDERAIKERCLLFMLKEAFDDTTGTFPAALKRCQTEVEASLADSKWDNAQEWDEVKNELRLVRAFSFVGEYAESQKETKQS